MEDNKKTTTMNVIVHKANIPMQGKESIGEFTNALSNAARKHTMQTLGIADGKGSGWVVEAYGDNVIVSSYKYDSKDPTKYYQMKYTRNKDGDFSFGTMVEVKRVTSFKPANPSVSVAKSKENSHWEEVKKSLFEDIV